MNRNCQHCQTAFEPNRRLGPKRCAAIRFCSRECVQAASRTVQPIFCGTCKVVFTPSNRRGKYCSLSCAAASHKGPLPTKGQPERYKRVSAPDGTRQLEHRVVMEQVLGRPAAGAWRVRASLEWRPLRQQPGEPGALVQSAASRAARR